MYVHENFFQVSTYMPCAYFTFNDRWQFQHLLLRHWIYLINTISRLEIKVLKIFTDHEVIDFISVSLTWKEFRHKKQDFISVVEVYSMKSTWNISREICEKKLILWFATKVCLYVKYVKTAFWINSILTRYQCEMFQLTIFNEFYL